VSYSKNIGVFGGAVGDLGEGWYSGVTRKFEDVAGVLDDCSLY
jgi:hypothetical protein